MKKILVLTDLSEASQHALSFARSFFSDTVVDFHLLCVHPPTLYRSPDFVYTTKTSTTACADQLRAILAELHQDATTNWHTFRSSDCPGDWLNVVRKSLEVEVYDYVLIGTNADGNHALSGNSTTALARQLNANVLIVPLHAPIGPVRRVVLATDFARLKNAKLLSPVKEIVLFKGAALTLLCIDTPVRQPIPIDKEIHIRTFLAPVDPGVTHIKAATTLLGFDAYINRHSVDLLVVLPNDNARTGSLADNAEAQSETYPFSVPLLIIYDDGSNDLPQRENALAATSLAF